MNRIIVFTLAVAAGSLVVFNAEAYDKDVHFHLTYYLARCAGFQESSAYSVAQAAQYTDEHGKTYPTLKPTGLGAEQRRIYHFPKWDSVSAPDTQRNSVQGRYEMTKVLEKAKTVASSGQELRDLLVRLGMSTHVLQDSYSHEGYGYRLGHAVDMHDPDRPYLRTTDGWDNPKKGLEMSKLVYTRYRNFLQNMGNTQSPVCTWTEMKPRLTEWLNYLDSSWSSLDYEDEIERRCGYWQSQIKNQTSFGDKSYNRSTFEATYKESFERAVSIHCLPHDKFAYDPSYTPAANQIAPSPTLPAPPAGGAELAGWLTALPKGASTLQIVQAMSDVDADARAELRAIHKVDLAKLAFNTRLALAHRLVQAGNVQDGEELFEKCRIQAKTAKERMAVLDWLPRTERFRAHFEHLLTAGTADEKNRASHALYMTGSFQARSSLKAYARSQKLETLAGDPAGYFALLSFDDPKPSKADTRFLVETLTRAVAQNHGTVIKPILIVLPTHAANGGQALAKGLEAALRVSDKQLRWQAGYAVEKITGRTLDLTRVESDEFVQEAERALSQARAQ